jgi:hypothetical protein
MSAQHVVLESHWLNVQWQPLALVATLSDAHPRLFLCLLPVEIVSWLQVAAPVTLTASIHSTVPYSRLHAPTPNSNQHLCHDGKLPQWAAGSQEAPE